MTSLLPSIASMGLWGYWVIGMMTFLEAFVLTSVFSPGTVVVVLGGALAAQGIYDVGDMMWFVGIGTIAGSQLSYWLGTKGEKLLGEGRGVLSAARLEKGRRFFATYGGASIVIGHFLGPLRPVAPVVAGLSGMERRRFFAWNVAGGAAYAVAMVSAGYFFGAAVSIFGASTSRVTIFAGAILAALILVWVLIWRLRPSLRLVPPLLRSAARATGENRHVSAFVARHPRLFGYLARRVSRQTFTGLPATLLGMAFLYFLALYAETVFEVLGHGSLDAADARLADLIDTVRSAQLTRFFTVVTGLGYWGASLSVAVASTVLMWLWNRKHYGPALWFTLTGNVATVTLLKHVFARARPEHATYVETTFSFPSGHSAAVAALYVFLAYVLIRERIGRDLAWILCAGTVIALVGLSRLYLGEHFLSDVLNGFLVGTLWAITGIFLAERLRPRRRALPLLGRVACQRVTAGVIAATAVVLWIVLQTYSDALVREAPATPASIENQHGSAASSDQS